MGEAWARTFGSMPKATSNTGWGGMVNKPLTGIAPRMAWRDRPDFTCFQGGTEMAAIAKGVKNELGSLANTQGKPEAGPWAAH